MITLLGGGIGASRFSKALAALVPAEQITCIVNTADDHQLVLDFPVKASGRASSN